MWGVQGVKKEVKVGGIASGTSRKPHPSPLRPAPPRPSHPYLCLPQPSPAHLTHTANTLPAHLCLLCILEAGHVVGHIEPAHTHEHPRVRGRGAPLGPERQDLKDLLHLVALLPRQHGAHVLRANGRGNG